MEQQAVTHIEFWTAAMVGLVVLFAFFVRGVSGFGSATIAIPLLAHAVPLRLAVPLLLVLDFMATLATLRIDRQFVDKSEVRRLLPFSMIGVVLGATLLIHLSPQLLLGGLGIMVVIFGVRTLLKPVSDKPVSTLWAAPAGIAGGILGGMFGSGAATPSMIYLTHRLEKRSVRATFSGFAIFDYGFRLITFVATGLLLQVPIGLLLAITVPAMALGQYLGTAMHHRISNDQALKLIGVLLLASGGSLLWKAWKQAGAQSHADVLGLLAKLIG
jgi:uncharacterized membrane protein YfcA